MLCRVASKTDQILVFKIAGAYGTVCEPLSSRYKLQARRDSIIKIYRLNWRLIARSTRAACEVNTNTEMNSQN